ncbi:MAG: sugar phosphate isomerase/epimerase family protein [Armatimonadota bacterium]|jgi:sugar phosphate isomerase/epimerase
MARRTANGARMNSIATDYQQGTGSPWPCLRAIAEAGFTHVHWCHHWNTDFLYSAPEISQILRWLGELGLSVTDIHASAGQEKAWASELEYERLAGVELVVNRLEMAARLGCDVAVLHIPAEPEEPAARLAYWERLRRSLDALMGCSRTTGVRIALENGGTPESWVPIVRVLSEYGPEFAGLCYDAGHGNISGDGLDRLEAHSDRLLSVHLHDNDGSGDQHLLPFMGTVQWGRLAGLIAGSSYEKWVNLEVSQARSGYDDGRAFLRDALAAAGRLAEAIATAGADHD